MPLDAPEAGEEHALTRSDLGTRAPAAVGQRPSVGPAEHCRELPPWVWRETFLHSVAGKQSRTRPQSAAEVEGAIIVKEDVATPMITPSHAVRPGSVTRGDMLHGWTLADVSLGGAASLVCPFFSARDEGVDSQGLCSTNPSLFLWNP